jgi:diguanylate cyclase (GGDEF)-like protein
MSSFAQERAVMSLTSLSFALCHKLARIENESSLYLALDEIVQEISKSCEVDAAVVVMQKPHQPVFTSYLHDIHAFGLQNDEKKNFSFLLAQAIVPEVVQRVHPMLRADVRQDLPREQTQGQRSKLVSMLAVPMELHGKVVGILVVFRSEIAAFCGDDAGFFQKVATLIAEEIDSSGAYLRLAKDQTTGFYSRRVFFEALLQETARARRYQEPLSALILEIDTPLGENKKTVEQFLKRFSQRVASETRQSDIVARVSDSAFLFLQPMTQMKSSIEFATRICEHFKQHPITLHESVVPLKIFGGVSGLLSEDEDGNAMLLRADNALHQAKKRGEGEIVAFG